MIYIIQIKPFTMYYTLELQECNRTLFDLREITKEKPVYVNIICIATGIKLEGGGEGG